MGLFDEIQKALREAMEEGQRQRGGRPRPSSRPTGRQEPASSSPQPPIETEIDREEIAVEVAEGIESSRSRRERQRQRLEAESDARQVEGATAVSEEDIKRQEYLAAQRRQRREARAKRVVAINTRNRLRLLLDQRQRLRDVILLREILDPPIALRRRNLRHGR